jgi:hypothetical protein
MSEAYHGYYIESSPWLSGLKAIEKRYIRNIRATLSQFATGTQKIEPKPI